MRLINADALKETITNNPLIDFTDDDIFELIDNAPTVEIPTELCKGCRFLKDCETCEEKLRPQGEWVKIGDIGLAYTCNKCGEVNVIPTNFCPNCGAKMKGGAE